MLSSGGTNRSLKMEAASRSTTDGDLKLDGLAGPSLSLCSPASSLELPRDDIILKRLDFLSEPPLAGESKVIRQDNM